MGRWVSEEQPPVGGAEFVTYCDHLFPCAYRGGTSEKQPAKLQSSLSVPSSVLSSPLSFVLILGSSQEDEVSPFKSLRFCKLECSRPSLG